MVKKLSFSKALWRSRRLFLSVLLVLLLSPIVFFTMERVKVVLEDLIATRRLVQRSLEDKVKKDVGKGCKMSHLETFDDDARRINGNLPPVMCEGTEWVACHNTECSVTNEILKTVKNVVCIYRNINYVDEGNFHFGNPIKVVGQEKFTLTNSDHVKIDCTGKNRKRLDYFTVY